MAKEELCIVDMGASGDGIARDRNGRTVFVPYAMTGDVVRAEIIEDKEILRAADMELVSAGPYRVSAPCVHFEKCGGCQFQHMGDAFYQAYKRHHVLEPLARIAVHHPEHITQIHVPQATRRRANFATITTKGKTLIGFHERKSGTIRDVSECLLISPDVRRVMEALRPFMADIAGDGKKMDVFIQCVDGQSEIGLTGKIAPGWEAQQALSDALRTTGATRISLRARDYDPYEIILSAQQFYKRFDSHLVELAPCAFLQPSAEGEQALLECVMRGAGDARCIVDLFCGNGTFTVPLMKHNGQARSVSGYDSASDAVRALQKAGVEAHVRNLFKHPVAGDGLQGVECVVLDPPRAGALEQVGALAQSYEKVPRIVYVSCNPQSFARDAKILQDAGYSMAELTIVDQFLWSSHTEVVGVFALT